jgi:hypothetical protein
VPKIVTLVPGADAAAVFDKLNVAVMSFLQSMP